MKMQCEGHAANSGSAFTQPDEDTILIAGAEIDVDAFNLVAFKAEKLGIAELLSASSQTFVSHKGLVAFDEDFFELVPLDPARIAPAAFEINGLVDLVVKRAGEAEIFGERVFDGLAVVRQIGGKEGADDLRAIANGHRASSVNLPVRSAG